MPGIPDRRESCDWCMPMWTLWIFVFAADPLLTWPGHILGSLLYHGLAVACCSGRFARLVRIASAGRAVPGGGAAPQFSTWRVSCRCAQCKEHFPPVHIDGHVRCKITATYGGIEIMLAVGLPEPGKTSHVTVMGCLLVVSCSWRRIHLCKSSVLQSFCTAEILSMCCSTHSCSPAGRK